MLTWMVLMILLLEQFMLTALVEILVKYKDHPRCLKKKRLLPVPSNVKYNAYLKEIAKDSAESIQVAAYDALSVHMQKFLEDLIAVHDFSWGFKESLAEPGGRERLADAVAANPPVRHPVIRTHPETGKKVLFVNSLFTTHIEGLRKEESKAVLDLLFQHIQTPEFAVRFSWEPHSIAIWDNRSTQHKPVNDYFPAHRRMERITIDGDRPY